MKIRGTAFWTSIIAPNDKFDEAVWETDLAVDAETSAALKEAGLKPRKEKADDGRDIFKFKRNVWNKKLKAENDPPVLLDQNGKPGKFLVGNGSEVYVQINIYKWENKFGSGYSADFQGMRVIDLVQYKAPDGAELLEEDEDGAELVSKAAKPKVQEFDDALPDSLL